MEDRQEIKSAVHGEQAIRLILPNPPATNNLYFTQILWTKDRPSKPYPSRVLTTEGKNYKKLVNELAEGFTQFAGDVVVEFRWYRPRKIGDLDGIFKIILDGMTGFVYFDDKQVKRIEAERFEDPGHPRVEVTVRPLGLC